MRALYIHRKNPRPKGKPWPRPLFRLLAVTAEVEAQELPVLSCLFAQVVGYKSGVLVGRETHENVVKATKIRPDFHPPLAGEPRRPLLARAGSPERLERHLETKAAMSLTGVEGV